MTPAGSPNADVRDDAAALIEEVSRIAQGARKYRALATTIADPTFDRMLAIGGEIRRAERAGQRQPIADAVEEMRRLRRRCEQGIRSVQEGASYRELVAAFHAGAVGRATELAEVVFTDVTIEVADRPLLWIFPLTARHLPSHFLPPDQCAEKIRKLAMNGIPAPTDSLSVGGDASIRPLPLAGTIDPTDGPITLAYEPGAIPGPIGRLTESDIALWYAGSLRAPFSVRAAATVGDEWWHVRPAAYSAYLAELANALAAAGIPFEIAPPVSDD